MPSPHRTSERERATHPESLWGLTTLGSSAEVFCTTGGKEGRGERSVEPHAQAAGDGANAPVLFSINLLHDP